MKRNNFLVVLATLFMVCIFVFKLTGDNNTKKTVEGTTEKKEHHKHKTVVVNDSLTVESRYDENGVLVEKDSIVKDMVRSWTVFWQNGNLRLVMWNDSLLSYKKNKELFQKVTPKTYTEYKNGVKILEENAVGPYSFYKNCRVIALKEGQYSTKKWNIDNHLLLDKKYSESGNLISLSEYNEEGKVITSISKDTVVVISLPPEEVVKKYKRYYKSLDSLKTMRIYDTLGKTLFSYKLLRNGKRFVKKYYSNGVIKEKGYVDEDLRPHGWYSFYNKKGRRVKHDLFKHGEVYTVDEQIIDDIIDNPNKWKIYNVKKNKNTKRSYKFEEGDFYDIYTFVKTIKNTFFVRRGGIRLEIISTEVIKWKTYNEWVVTADKETSAVRIYYSGKFYKRKKNLPGHTSFQIRILSLGREISSDIPWWKRADVFNIFDERYQKKLEMQKEKRRKREAEKKRLMEERKKREKEKNFKKTARKILGGKMK